MGRNKVNAHLSDERIKWGLTTQAVLLSHQKEQGTDTYNMVETEGDYADKKRKKAPNSKGSMSFM